MNFNFRMIFLDEDSWMKFLINIWYVLFGVLSMLCYQDLVLKRLCFFSLLSWVRFIDELSDIISVRLQDLLLFRIRDVLILQRVNDLFSPEVTHEHSKGHLLRIIIFRTQIFKEILYLRFRISVNFDGWYLLFLSFNYRLRVTSVQIWFSSVIERRFPVLSEVGEGCSPDGKVVFVTIILISLLVNWGLINILFMERAPHRFVFAIAY